MKKIKKIKLLILTFVLSGFSVFAQTPVIQFDGVDDYVSLGAAAGNNLRTIEMWFSPRDIINNTSTTQQTLVARETSLNNSTPEFQLFFWNGDGRLRFTIDQGPTPSSTIFSTTNTWNAGEWYHVAVVIDPISGTTMYVNGIAEATDISLTAATAPFTGSYTVDYTALGCWGEFQQRFFAGKMEDIRFSTEPLYSENFEPPCPTIEAEPSTIGLWTWNVGVGLMDASLNGNDAIGYGTVWTDDFICEDLCACNAEVSFESSSPLTASGNQTTEVLIDTEGEMVTSICIELPYFRSTVPFSCIDCELTQITANGTILGGTTLGGVVGELDDPYSLGHARKICYEFDAPTAINESVFLDLQFPAVMDVSTGCKNGVEYCLDVEIKDENCKVCEYEVCTPPETLTRSTVKTNSNDSRIDQQKNLLDVLIYPVPATSSVTIEIHEKGFQNATIQITSLDGKLLKSQYVSSKKVEIDLSDLTPGMYNVAVQSNDKKSSQNVIVQ